MEILDKHNILPNLASRSKVIIELGCGTSRRIKDAISIDIIDVDSVDIVTNVDQGLSFLPDNSVDEIYSFHFMEHLSDISLFMNELFRVLKPGGKKIGTVPHFSNPYYYSDYTHRSFWGLYSFSYFSKERYFKRGVPNFYQDINFKINKIEIVFYSSFKFINIFKKIEGFIFNLNKPMLELYEGSWCYTFPAHEIYFEIEKK
ncbi:MAG: class I SAM-dependent methyltransferase [Bacteroidia bacterium]